MATIPVYNPQIPFLGMIPGGFRPSLMVRLKGRMKSKKARCMIDFINSAALNSGQDVIFHMSIRMDEKCIVRNTFKQGHWLGEERYGAFRISYGDPFEIIILAEYEFYKIAVNGVHLGVFRHRLPLNLVQYIHVSGDVHVDHILFEQDVKSAQEHAKLGLIVATAIHQSPTVHTHHLITPAASIPTHSHHAINPTPFSVETNFVGNSNMPVYPLHERYHVSEPSGAIYATHEAHMASGLHPPAYTSSVYPSIGNEVEVQRPSPSAPPIYSTYEAPPSYTSQHKTWLATPFFEIEKRPDRLVLKTSKKESSLKF